jgi:putative ATP-dependent endonuclease of OLD family
VPCDDGFHRIFYRLEGEMAENEGVLTLRDFLDEKASPIPLDNIDDLAAT